jgi:RNA polymerase sigma factor (sigma-70 family)
VNTTDLIAGDQELLRLYIADVGRHPLLSREDEARLSAEIQAGRQARALVAEGAEWPGEDLRNLRRTIRRGLDAERTLVQSNLRLVVFVAKQYRSSGVSIMDLIQEGNIGLMRAVEKFDGSMGYRFATYAIWWIRRGVERAIGNQKHTIRLPLPAGRQLANIKATRHFLAGELGRNATDAEVAGATGISEGRIAVLSAHQNRPVSLSAPVSESGGTLDDLIADETSESPFDAAATATLPAVIDRVLDRIPARERDIISLRFGLGETEARSVAEIARIYGLSTERIRQIEARAMARLRALLGSAEHRELLCA